MITNRDDDYLICKHYYNNIDNISPDYPDFITFEHNGNHFFAWVNDGKVILRSEAYPDHERTVRGIKAIIKNRDIADRYTIDSQHGAHFLVLWGGGSGQSHTGRMGQHNEIGRSCPTRSKEDLYSMFSFHSLADKIFGMGGAINGSKAAATTASVAAASLAASSSSNANNSEKKTAVAATTQASSGGGFKWWWLLPLLLIPAFFLWKGCGDKKASVAPVKKEVKTKVDKAVTDTKTDLAASKAEETRLAAEAKAQAAKIRADEKAKAEADAKAAREAKAAERKAKSSGSINQTNQFIGNKNSGF